MPAYVKKRVPSRPSIRIDRSFAEEHGGALIAGVDEAGRGPLAGPVVAAAVALPFQGPRPRGLRDSKQLTEKVRDRLFTEIQSKAISYGIGIVHAEEIDLLNILEATRLAVARALEQMDPQPEALVTDALHLPRDPRPVLPLVKGDNISSSVSAASILAKVTRDRLMDLYHEEFPEFGWKNNRGYPTQDHYAALQEHGPTTLHRLSFNGVGFFDVEPRRCPTYIQLREKIEHPGTIFGRDDHWLEQIREKVFSSQERLPPPDFQHLLTLIEAYQQGNQPDEV